MHYPFPEIRTINDVLPYIEGRIEFVVAERDYGTVINYVVAMQDTFDMTDADDLGGAIRRECRGLIFDTDGNIMSRPFHKFFNVNEREETQAHCFKMVMAMDHVVMEKMDGSMIRPLLVDGYLRLGTKMGVTTVAMQAEEWLATQSPERKTWLRKCVEDGVTPLFEWTSPDNRIVLEYVEPDLVYLGTRDNVTGAYVMDTSCPFNQVSTYGTVRDDFNQWIGLHRIMENREGDIIRFADGHMVKIKNDWYVRIHKAMDRIRFDRNIVNLIINEELDDLIPMLPENEVERIREFEENFWHRVNVQEIAFSFLLEKAQEMSDRKAVALELVPTLDNKQDASLLFKMLDGTTPREVVLSHIKQHIGTNARWDKCAEWLKS